MASSPLPVPSSTSMRFPFCRHKQLMIKYPQVRSQTFKDDGTSANIVDANLGVLRERIAEVRMKERLDACRRYKVQGWNYKSGYDPKHKRQAMASQSLELIGSTAGALGLVFLTGSLCICLVSLLAHFFS